MLVLETVLRIRREHTSGKAIKAIARDLHLSRKVVRKAIRAPEADMGYRREVQPLPKLGPFRGRLDAMLEEDEARVRREKLRLTRIHDLLLREGFDGSYDAVRRYEARWRQARRRDVMDAPAFISLRFRPAEAYQFDRSHEDVEIAGKRQRLDALIPALIDTLEEWAISVKRRREERAEQKRQWEEQDRKRKDIERQVRVEGYRITFLQRQVERKREIDGLVGLIDLWSEARDPDPKFAELLEFARLYQKWLEAKLSPDAVAKRIAELKLMDDDVYIYDAKRLD